MSQFPGTAYSDSSATRVNLQRINKKTSAATKIWVTLFGFFAAALIVASILIFVWTAHDFYNTGSWYVYSTVDMLSYFGLSWADKPLFLRGLWNIFTAVPAAIVMILPSFVFIILMRWVEKRV